MQYGRTLNYEYKKQMDEITEFTEEYHKRLCRPIKDLDDVRHSMAGLETIRQKQIAIDMSLGPIEVSIIPERRLYKWR